MEESKIYNIKRVKKMANLSINGEIINKNKYRLIDNIELLYGFGVYENLRVRNGYVLFPKEHIERLLHSARIIGLDHELDNNKILQWIDAFVMIQREKTYNLKLVLIGSKMAIQSTIFIFAVRPSFIPKKVYNSGVDTIGVIGERFLPQAKTLGMLMSYIMFKKATERGCYDTILLDRNGFVTEGTRANIFGIENKTIIMPMKNRILEGVTMQCVLEIARNEGFNIKEANFTLEELIDMGAAFFTSTSCKILPIKSINGKGLRQPIPETLKFLMRKYDELIENMSEKNGRKL